MSGTPERPETVHRWPRARRVSRGLGFLIALVLGMAPVAGPALAQAPEVQIKAGCAGVDNSPPFVDPFTEMPIETPSVIPVGASVDGAPEGASFHMEIEAPDGTLLTIRSAVDGKGRVAGATGIFTFGIYVATNPIVIGFTDPTTGQKVEVKLDPSAVFPADGFVVGPEEVECNVDDLPPGDLLVVTAPPPESESQPPRTGSQPPVQPPVSSGGGGAPVIWIVVIGGGVVLLGLGTLTLVKRTEGVTPPATPGTYRTSDKEGTVPTTQEKPPDPRGFDPKRQPFPEDEGIPWILEWKLDALIWNQFAILNALKAIGFLLAVGLAAIIGLLAAILAAIQAGFALLAGLLAGIFALLAFFVIRLVVPIVMEREREKIRRMYPPA